MRSTVPVSGSTANVVVDIAISSGTSVQLVQNGHAPVAISACEIHVNDTVMLWAPLENLVPGGWLDPLGYTASLGDITFGAQQVIVVRDR